MSTTHSAISGVVDHTYRRNDSTSASNQLSTFIMIPRTVHFGKYHIPTSLPKLQPVSDTAWRKKAGFDQLTLTIYGLLKLLPAANLIPLIAREVPTETFTAQQEATKVMYKIRRCVFDVNHLQTVVFLNASGKTVNVKSEKLNDRPRGLTLSWLSCEIDILYIKKTAFSSASNLTNNSTILSTGSLRPRALPENASKRPRGVRVVWMTSYKDHWLLELVSVMIFLMLRPMWHISTRKPVTTMAKMMELSWSHLPHLAQANLEWLLLHQKWLYYSISRNISKLAILENLNL